LIDWDALTERGGASWVESANDPDGGFPLDNLPYCIFEAGHRFPRVGVRIGDRVLDLAGARGSGILEGLPVEILSACEARTLNKIMACASVSVAALRTRLTTLLHAKADEATLATVGTLLFPVEDATLLKPVEPANYTDFYASIDHATNVGRIFRPDSPLLPN